MNTSDPDPLITFIDEHLVAVLDRPRMWGSLEAVEATILTLLEVRHFHLAPPEKARALLDLYRHELAKEVGRGNTPLHVRAPEEEDFVQHMRNIVARIQAQM